MLINTDVVKKLLTIVDAGLVNGLGKPIPGQMCVEAAVCYALDLPHGDDPQCVAPTLRALKIKLNDSNWSSNEARAKGLRRLAVIQLGSKDNLDATEFKKRVAELATKTCVPIALRAAASINKNPSHKQALLDAANKCEVEGSKQSAIDARQVAKADAYAAYAAAAYAADAAEAAAYAADAYAADAYAAYAADAAEAAAAAAAAEKATIRDKILSDFAEGVVQILIEIKVPGCEWLPLTEIA